MMEESETDFGCVPFILINSIYDRGAAAGSGSPVDAGGASFRCGTVWPSGWPSSELGGVLVSDMSVLSVEAVVELDSTSLAKNRRVMVFSKPSRALRGLYGL